MTDVRACPSATTTVRYGTSKMESVIFNVIEHYIQIRTWVAIAVIPVLLIIGEIIELRREGK